MVIKRFTQSVGSIINLVPGDVGRPLQHFASNLRYEHLLRDVQQVLNRLTSVELNIQSTSDEWYTMRILPYRTLDNYISGAIITFTRITGLKNKETQLQDTANFLEEMQASMHEPLVAFDERLRVYFSNQAFANLFEKTPADLHGQPLRSLGQTWDAPALRTPLEELLAPDAARTTFDELVLDAELPGLGQRRLYLYGRLLRQQPAGGRVLLGIKNIERL
jgi:two-component system CheB/CheR fusion protein